MLTVMFRLLSRMLVWPGGKRRAEPAPKLPPAAAAVAATALAPAVAGFVHRIAPPADFRLAARIAGVAYLNTRAGRIPRPRGRVQPNTKPIPKLVSAAHKNSKNGKSSKLHAPRPPIVVRGRKPDNTNVVPLRPTTVSQCVPLEARIRLAA